MRSSTARFFKKILASQVSWPSDTEQSPGFIHTSESQTLAACARFKDHLLNLNSTEMSSFMTFRLQFDTCVQQFGYIRTNVVFLNFLKQIKDQDIDLYNTCNDFLIRIKFSLIDALDYRQNLPEKDYSSMDLDQVPVLSPGMMMKHGTSDYAPFGLTPTKVKLSDLNHVLRQSNQLELKDLIGACGQIAFAELFAKPELNEVGYLKVVMLISHYSDLNDSGLAQDLSDFGHFYEYKLSAFGARSLDVIAAGCAAFLRSKTYEEYLKPSAVVVIPRPSEDELYQDAKDRQDSATVVFYSKESGVVELPSEIKVTRGNIVQDAAGESFCACVGEWEDYLLNGEIMDERNEAILEGCDVRSVGIVCTTLKGAHYAPVIHDFEGSVSILKESMDTVSTDFLESEFVMFSIGCGMTPPRAVKKIIDVSKHQQLLHQERPHFRFLLKVIQNVLIPSFECSSVKIDVIKGLRQILGICDKEKDKDKEKEKEMLRTEAGQVASSVDSESGIPSDRELLERNFLKIARSALDLFEQLELHLDSLTVNKLVELFYSKDLLSEATLEIFDPVIQLFSAFDEGNDSTKQAIIGYLSTDSDSLKRNVQSAYDKEILQTAEI